MKDFNFSKNMTNAAKGLAIILMIFHHLFAFPDRIAEDYQSVFMIGDHTIEQIIGQFGKLCVGIFLFLSGYGLYKTYQSKRVFTFKDSVKRVIQFWKIYLIVFAIFVPIGLYFFKDNPRFIFDMKTFLFNLLTLKSSYNGEWWFASLYIELLLLFPLMLKLIEKYPVLMSYLSFSALFFSEFFRKLIPFFPNNEYIQMLLYHLRFLTFWQMVFIVGVFFAKYGLFEKMNGILIKLRLDNVFTHFSILIFCIFFRQYFLFWVIDIADYKYNDVYNYADFILAPVMIFSFVKILSKVNSISKIFELLGVHSNNIWLTHTFFAYHFTQNLIFYPYYAPLIVVWIFIVTILTSMIINGIVKLFNKQKTTPV